MLTEQQMIQMMIDRFDVNKNPLAKTALEMYQKNDKAGLQQMATNMCKEKGLTPEKVMQTVIGAQR